MGKARFAVGAIVGAVAGIIAGILTAPRSGKETRADLTRKADELKRGAASRAKDAKKRGQEVAEDIRGKVQDYKERGERAKVAAEKETKTKKK